MTDSLSREIQLLLKDIVKKDIKHFILSITQNKKGDGNLGNTFFLSLKEVNGNITFNLVVKQAFTDGVLRKMYPIREVFGIEIHFYTKVWKKMQEFLNRFQPENVFDKLPKCLASNYKEYSEVLILEDMKCQNFEVFDKRKTFDRCHLELLFHVYARFHAISFAFKALAPEEYHEVTQGIEGIWYNINDFKYFPNLIKALQELSLKCLLPHDNVLEKYKKYVENGAETFTNNLIYDGGFSAILHGDCWSNNMLFKYESEEVVDVRLIDFQFAKIGTPVYDLSYCLYSGSGKECFENLDYYLKIYHDCLSKTLNDFGCDGEKLYPFAALKEDWKKYSKFGFNMSLLVWKIKLTFDQNSVEFADFKGDDFEVANGFVSAEYDEDAYKKIIRDIILHMYENDFI